MEAIQELFNGLESSNPAIAEEAKKKFREYFNSTKEPWLLNGMFDYYINSGSEQSMDALIGIREPHYGYLFDRIFDTLNRGNRLAGLTLLGHMVRKHPSWIYKIASHAVFKELIRILKIEKDVIILMSALLIVVILLPIIASLVSPYLQDLFEIFSHLAVWKTSNPHKVPEGYLLHVEIGMYALFNRLYGMFPCNFLSYLRHHYSSKDSLAVFTHTIKPMLDTVRMHPLLVTASKEHEVSISRWKKIEPNDVILECAKFSVEGHFDRYRDCSFRRNSSSNRTRTRFNSSAFLQFESMRTSDGSVQLGKNGVPVVASYSMNLPEPAEVWSLAVRSGAVTPPGDSSIPHTPIIEGCAISAYSPKEGNSPPEAAIEATPESTPIKDIHEYGGRAHSAAGSSVVRSLSTFHSQPSSPLRKEYPSFKLPSTPTGTGLQRVHRVITERSQQTENVFVKPKETYPPGSPLRLIPQAERGRPYTPGDRSDEDREVETTMTILSNPPSRQIKREDSVLDEASGDGISEETEWREWKEGGELRLPECKSVNSFARRLRCYSHCQPETLHLLSTGFSCGNSPKKSKKSVLRRTLSCPDVRRLSETRKFGHQSKLSFRKNKNRVEKSFVTSGTQTDPVQPLVYEHLLFSVLSPYEPIQQHSAPPDVTSPPLFQEDRPKGALDAFIDTTVKSVKENKHGFENIEMKHLVDQISLLQIQLQFERHRREVHAERNRRLLGRNRENRVLEEHNSALRDQVQLLQRDIEMLHEQLARVKRDGKNEQEQQQKTIAFWEKQNATLHNRFKEATETIKRLSEDAKEEKRKKETIAKGYAELESEVLGLRYMKEEAELAMQRSEEMKVQLGNLQHHLISAGELELRLRSWINDLVLTANTDIQAQMMMKSYEHKMAELNKKMLIDSTRIEAASQKLKLAEELYKKREQLAVDQNEYIEIINSDCDQHMKDSKNTCSKLREVNALREREMLRLQSQLDRLEDKVKKLSADKPATVNSPSHSVIPPNTGNFAITDETVPLKNLEHIIEQNEKGARDLNHPH